MAGVARTGSNSNSGRIASLILPSLSDIVFISVLIAVPTALGKLLLNSDGDAARHIAVGSLILDKWAIPTADVFSHTKAGQPFVPYEWLSEVFFALAHRLMGTNGVALLSAVVIAVTFWLLSRWLMAEGVPAIVAMFLAMLAAAASSFHFFARPHIFTMLLTLVIYWLLEEHWERGTRLIFVIPMLMVLWVNLHGGFLVGFGMLLLYLGFAVLEWLHDRRFPLTRARSLAIALSASLPAVVIHPAGPNVLPHVTSILGLQYLVDRIGEHMSPNFHSSSALPFLMLLLLTLLTVALNKGRIKPRHFALLLLWITFSLYSVRNVPLFAILATPIIGALLTGLLNAAVQRKMRWQWLQLAVNRLRTTSKNFSAISASCSRSLSPLFATIVLLGIGMNNGYFGTTRVLDCKFDPAVFPVDAAGFVLEQRISGRMFNNYIWGGYLIYSLFPEYQVFLDGQADFYGEDLVKENLAVTSLEPGWREVLDKYGVNWVIMPAGSRVDVLLSEVTDWRLVYRDKTAVIYVRNVPENAGIPIKLLTES